MNYLKNMIQTKMMIKILNDDSFNEQISQELLIVHFYADWCGPCKMVDQILASYNIPVLKVAPELYPELTKSYRISSIPSVLIFKNGEVVDKLIGFNAKEKLVDFLNNIENK